MAIGKTLGELNIQEEKGALGNLNLKVDFQDRLKGTLGSNHTYILEAMFNDINTNFRRIKARNIHSKAGQNISYPETIEEVLQNCFLDNETRLNYASRLLGIDLNYKQKNAILEAHNLGNDEYIPFSSVKSNDQYRAILKQKRDILLGANLSAEQIEVLFDYCICLGLLPTVFISLLIVFIAGGSAVIASSVSRFEDLINSEKYKGYKHDVNLFMEKLHLVILQQIEDINQNKVEIDPIKQSFIVRGLINKMYKLSPKDTESGGIYDILEADNIKEALTKFSYYVDGDQEKINLIKEFITDFGYTIYFYDIYIVLSNFRSGINDLKQ